MISERPRLDDYPTLRRDIQRAVEIALEEDIGDGDITAQLIPADKIAEATIITREDCVVCGLPWVDEVFRQLDDQITIRWEVQDGDQIKANTTLCHLEGNARTLLTGERTALNFLQLLSGTASTSRQYAELVKDSHLKILDTRKTIPGLRTAQKYAVRCGGCYNHRMGLYDAFLIKENHIAACGGIEAAVNLARQQAPGKLVEIEVESVEQFHEAVATHADTIMLDNFSDQDMSSISGIDTTAKIESSGSIDIDSLSSQTISHSNYISIGALTKNVNSIDLSMRINQ